MWEGRWDSDFSLDWGCQGAEPTVPGIGVLPRTTLLGSSSHGGRGLRGPPHPGCSLLGAALCALGSAAVVPDEAAKAHSHGRVTVVHGHHSHLLSRRPMGQAQAADVGLQEERTQKASACAPTSRHVPPAHGC